jgi:predicted transcriptional regulator
MILPEVKYVLEIRHKMGLTLKQFASKCELDVSWINQVEAGKIKDPSYLKMKKILDMYEFEKHGLQRTAGEICIKKIISFEIDTPIQKANRKMIDTGISQIPVFKKNECVGMITDKTILKLARMNDVSGLKIVPEMLEIPPPMVDAKMPLHELVNILEYHEYVLVGKEGFIHGILVRQDVNKLLGK